MAIDRLSLLHQQKELQEQYCNECIKRTEHDYCITKCPVGNAFQEIGEKLLGRPFKQTYQTIEERDIGLSRKEFVRMKKNGIRDKEIVAMIGVSASTLSRKKRHWGLKK